MTAECALLMTALKPSSNKFFFWAFRHKKHRFFCRPVLAASPRGFAAPVFSQRPVTQRIHAVKKNTTADIKLLFSFYAAVVFLPSHTSLSTVDNGQQRSISA